MFQIMVYKNFMNLDWFSRRVAGCLLFLEKFLSIQEMPKYVFRETGDISQNVVWIQFIVYWIFYSFVFISIALDT